jgi:ATP-dependent DNA helicase RecG
VVGIEEDKGRPVLPPIGLAAETIDDIQKELLNLCNRLKPHYFPIVEPMLLEGKHILVIWVPGGQNRPYQAPVTLQKKSDYAYYIRRFSNTVKAQMEDVKELLSLAGSIPFDDRIQHNARVSDLKLALIQSFLGEIDSDLSNSASDMPLEQLCRQMMIVDGADEYIKPRNVGLLFFNDKPQKFIPMAQVEMVWFKDTPAGDRLEEKVYQGPIDHQVRSVLRDLNNMVLIESVRKLPDRAEAIRFFNYPITALEESIVNAMYHRSYEIREPVEIRIHPDRIEILSFPGPDRSIKQADLEQGKLVSRRYRNRRIGDFFKELKFTEGRSTGIPKIIRAMKKNGSPPPIFKTDEERSYFLTILNIHPGFQAKSDDAAGEGFVSSSSNVGNGNGKHTDSKDARILEFCLTPRKKRDILDYIGLSSGYANFKRYILPLLQRGLLARTEPFNLSSPYQRYRMTPAGGKWMLREGIG